MVLMEFSLSVIGAACLNNQSEPSMGACFSCKGKIKSTQTMESLLMHTQHTEYTVMDKTGFSYLTYCDNNMFHRLFVCKWYSLTGVPSQFTFLHGCSKNVDSCWPCVPWCFFQMLWSDNLFVSYLCSSLFVSSEMNHS